MIFLLTAALALAVSRIDNEMWQKKIGKSVPGLSNRMYAKFGRKFIIDSCMLRVATDTQSRLNEDILCLSFISLNQKKVHADRKSARIRLIGCPSPNILAT